MSAPQGVVRDLEERTWMDAALRGEREGVDALVARCAGVARILRARLARHGAMLPAADLQDLEQEVLAAVWRNLPSFAGRSSFATWLYAICTRQVYQYIDKRRRRGRQRELGEDEAEPIDPRSIEGEESASDLDVSPARLATAMRELRPPADRVVELRFLAGYSLKRIADDLDLPLGTVKTHLYRGLRRMRELLERRDDTQRKGGSREC